MPAAKNDDGQPSSVGLANAAERLRSSARWLIASFGAVAAAVVVGISVSDIGALSGDTPGYRLALAIGGAVLAIVGVLGALARSMALAAASVIGIHDLAVTPRRWQLSLRYARDRIKADPALAPWNGDLHTFHRALEVSRRDQKKERDWYLADKSTTPYVGSLNRATMVVNELERVLARILETISFLRLQHGFRIARIVIVAWLIVAATGVLVFAYAAHVTPNVSIAAAPATASLRVPSDDRTFVSHRLGTGCDHDLDAVPVVVLALVSETGRADVVTLPTATCSPVRLDIPDDRLTGPTPEVGTG